MDSESLNLQAEEDENIKCDRTRTVYVDARVEWSNPALPNAGIPVKATIAAYCHQTKEAVIRDIKPRDLGQSFCIESAEVEAIQMGIVELQATEIYSDHLSASKWNFEVPVRHIPRKDNKIADWLTKSKLRGRRWIILRSTQPCRGWIEIL